ncbi:MAG: tetratricopeptide repeat protein [Deltaproteobacteria bacterium]|jgi:hypothetical protein|nr:tetratricopeptide repeat protein [Deltaproteobacteria bacterium]
MRIFALLAIGIAVTFAAPARAEMGGVYQGCWTDYEGNNHCGDAPSGGSSYGGGYDPSAYVAAAQLGEALGLLAAQAIQDMAVAAQGYEINARGNRLAARGDFEAAISAYQQALQFVPNDPIVLQNLRRANAGLHLARGRAHHERNDLESALAEYREALAYDPANRTAHQFVRLAEQKQAYARVRQREAIQRAQMEAAAQALHADAVALARSLRSAPGAESSVLELEELPPSAYGPERGLRIKRDIPLPGAGPSVSPPSLAERSEALRPYIDAADELIADASLALWEGKIWLRTRAANLGVNAVLDTAARAVPLVARVQQVTGMARETEALYDQVGRPQVETARGALGHLDCAVGAAVDPNQRTSCEEIDAWLDSQDAKYRELADETYLSKYRSKAKGLSEGFRRQREALANQAKQVDATHRAERTPILGIESHDRQRQRELNRQR